MQSSAWIELVRLIPPDKHDALVVMTENGTEINVQGILRVEKDFLVLRGRLAGSTEGGKIFFLPYDRMQYLGFRDAVKETDIQALFPEPEAPSAGRPSKTDTGAALAPDAAARPGTSPSAQPAAPLPTVRPEIPLPGKAALLERLRRARLGQQPLPPPDK